MRRIYSLLMTCTLAIGCLAQTQQGVVKTRGKMVNGKLVPGVGLSGATVTIQGRSSVLSQASGAFSFPTPGKRYLVKGCEKKGYQLIDMQVCREYNYSDNPLYLVMEPPEQQQADLLAKERTLRRELQRRLQQREDEVDNLNLSLHEKNALLQEINRQRDENEKLIKDLAQYYSTLDYDLLDDFQRQVSYLLENNELEKADSMLRSRGSMELRIAEIRREQEAEAKEDSIIAQRQLNNETSKAGTRRKLEDVAADCYNFYLRFSQAYQNDSAAHYLECRAALDTTNIEWHNEVGYFIADHLADYNKALTYFNRCLRQAFLQEGAEGEWVATSYNNIGYVYERQSDYAKALEYHQKALAIKEKVFGTEHPDVAMSYGNIGSVYSRQGDYAKALEYFQKALAISEKVLGTEHPDVATSYNNIGSVYSSQGDYAKALEYFQKALAIREKVFGTEHPDVATSYNNIGSVYSRQGDYAKALEYFQKALAISEKVLGTEHPDVATSYNNIGSVYSRQGDYAKALEYFQKALAISEKVLGTEHPDVATSYNNIGYDYYSQGDYAKALEYFQKALAILEKVFGTEHPNVAMSYGNIGNVYYSQGDYAKALEYFQKALAISEKVLGTEHPDVATSYSSIGYVYYSQGDYAKALEYFQKALAIWEKVFGTEHPDVATSYNNIGLVYGSQGDYAKALEYFQKALAIREKVFGTEHPDVATSYSNIGNVYYSQGDYAKALEYHQKALVIREKVLGTEHPSTKTVKENIIFIGKEMITSNPERMKDYIFTATVVDGDSPARQQQMSGEYIVLEFADWNIESMASLFDVNGKMRGKPKTIVVMKNDEISRHHFENAIGVQLDMKQVGEKEKKQMIEKYHQWKNR